MAQAQKCGSAAMLRAVESAARDFFERGAAAPYGGGAAGKRGAHGGRVRRETAVSEKVGWKAKLPGSRYSEVL